MIIPTLCPCCSKKTYQDCCSPYHNGVPAENAEALMRSRYTAYALHLVDYIIRTTHPENPQYMLDFTAWKKDLREFCKHTTFVQLEVLEFIDGKEEAFVTFVAHLRQGGHDASFMEKSRFVKVGGCWLYIDGKIKRSNPH